MTILFLHGWQSVPGGVKPTYLKDHGHEVINPALPDDDFDEAVRIAQAEFDLCYTAAKRWAMVANADWIVIHGSVVSQGKRIDHAWCELGDVVVDLTRPVGARITERNHYYRLVKPEVHKAYSTDDALIAALRNGHDGPWD